MEKKTYVIWDSEVMYGVVTAENNDELKLKIVALLDGIREEISLIQLLPELDDFNESWINVFYNEDAEDDDEEFSIQRVNII